MIIYIILSDVCDYLIEKFFATLHFQFSQSTHRCCSYVHKGIDSSPPFLSHPIPSHPTPLPLFSPFPQAPTQENRQHQQHKRPINGYIYIYPEYTMNLVHRAPNGTDPTRNHAFQLNVLGRSSVASLHLPPKMEYSMWIKVVGGCVGGRGLRAHPTREKHYLQIWLFPSTSICNLT